MSQKPKAGNVHGEGGAFVGGKWVDIEDCDKKFAISDGSCKDCKACPRSRSHTVAIKPDGSYDVIIIGAGCIGASIARELSKTNASVLVLEAADDVTQGATKGNSGIVHAGYDDPPGSIKSRYCWAGNQMFPQLDHDLHFGYELNGSLVVAKKESDMQLLEELLAKGKQNGVKNLRILDQKQLREIEPHIHPDACAALHSPDAGTLTPYEFAIALAENAADNGVEFRIRREVTAVKKNDDGSFIVTANHWEPNSYIASKSSGGGGILPLAIGGGTAAVLFGLLSTLGLLESLPVPPMVVAIVLVLIGMAAAKFLGPSPASKAAVQGQGGDAVSVDQSHYGGSGAQSYVGGAVVETETIRARYIVNAAGGAADQVAKMVGDTSFYIKPRLGEYILLTKEEGYLVNNTLFPTPDPIYGKGVLVQKTLWGNLILGPTARDTHNKEQMKMTKEEVLKEILGKCASLVPEINVGMAFHCFSGARAKSSTGDWVIGPSAACAGFINVAGIDSPGLAGSPAIAVDVVKMLKTEGLTIQDNPNFNPKRAPIITVKKGWKGLKPTKYGTTPAPPPTANVVCKCEKVTEEEVVRAIRRNLPVDSTQAIRKRTRAGMGHCQGNPDNYDCEARVREIIARETKLQEAAVGGRPWPATSFLPQRWLTDAQKGWLKAMQE